MDNKNTKVLEALRMQPLSEEEKTARHILGRMYGPIATCKESTRNGRLYNKPLWEKALVDDVFLEKVATKALFLELGHPADREETDMTKICACIPEVPKIVDGDLYAYVDILDTPNGKILKTLTDYGFVPGISSRGSGDIMPNDEVDPETFFLETWDIVQLPAVKKARLSMCESLSSSNKSLKSALVESMQGVEERDRMIMKEALDNLEITVEEETLEEDRLLPGGTPANPDEIPFEDDILTEEAEDEVDVEVTEEPVEVEEPVEDSDEAAEEPTEDTETSEDEDSETEDETVDDFIQALADEFDEEALLKLELVDMEGNEIEVADVDLVTDTNEDGDEVAKIVITGGEPTDNEIDEEDQDEAEDTEVIEEIPEDTEAEENAEADEEVSDEEVEETEETADDDGELEVIESLKEMIRQKDSLSKEVKNLQTQKTVGDAKVKALEEELARYKGALARVSPIATKATKMEKENKKLSEQLDTQTKLVEQLTAQQKESTQLTESVDNSKKQIKDLTAKLEDAEKTEKALREQIQDTGRKFEERTKIAKSYKAKYLETLRCYVESKAAMLGVPASEITTKLGESYTPADIDHVCDQILESAVPMTRLPFSGKTRGSARIAESVKSKAKTAPEYGYDIDDDLLMLAGLK